MVMGVLPKVAPTIVVTFLRQDIIFVVNDGVVTISLRKRRRDLHDVVAVAAEFQLWLNIGFLYYLFHNVNNFL